MSRRARMFIVLVGTLTVLAMVASQNACALPAFARQTGQACVACHVSFPELTPYGRNFKLSGYTIGTRQTFPLAIMAQAGDTHVQNNKDDQGNAIVPKTDSLQLSAASVFLAGKVNDNIGGWIQWTYNNLNVNGDGNIVGHSGIDNTDLRVVGRIENEDQTSIKWLYGVTLHNNPTVQDVWNSTPAFGFPFTTPPNGIGPAAATLIDGGLGQQVAGIGAYVYWNSTIYAEFAGYRTADGVFSALRAGQDTHSPGGVARLDGYNPYWRLAYNHEWGPSSIMFGTYGMKVKLYPDNTLPFTPTDHYTDVAFDAQYQYISQEHTITAQITHIHENQDYRASFPATLGGNPIGAGPTPNNPNDSLNTSKFKVSYYYQRQYGATLFYFRTTGTADSGLYGPGSVGGSNNSSPSSAGFVYELDYMPIQNLRLMLQYYDYQKFNGGNINYDGAGRNASANNTLFLNAWVAF